MDSYFVPFVNTECAYLVSAILVAGLTIFYKTRYRWPIKVNCWFCNSYTQVWKDELNWWLCPSCQQYNGFTKDGDYNFSIHKYFNKKTQNYSVLHKTKLSDYGNGLCETCNKNEEFKLMELRKFENLNKNVTDEELMQLRLQYDKKYPLCMDCNQIVKCSLYKQSLWLAKYLLLFKQKSLKNIMNNKKTMEKICRIILICVNITMNFKSLLLLSVITGIIVQLIVTLVNLSLRKLMLNLLLILLWINVGSLTILPEIPLVLMNSSVSWIPLKHISTYHMVLLFRLIIALENLTMKFTSTGFKHNISFKKIESYNKNMFPSKQPEVKTSLSAQNMTDSINEKLNHSPVNMTSALSTSSPVKTPIPLKVEYIQKPVSKPQEHYRSRENIYTTSYQVENIERKYTPTVYQSYSNDINFSTKSLSSLSLNDLSDYTLTKSSNVFSTKTYGKTTPNIFHKQSARKIALAPAKLSFADQSNWSVTWQDNLEMPSMSRPSSQSSGFGSNISNPSRENSVFEADRFSDVSNVTLCCHQRHNCESALNSTKSQNKFVRRESISPCSFSSAKCDHSFNSLDRKAITMVVASPPWLPTLVCGVALLCVINIAMLCVVLLR